MALVGAQLSQILSVLSEFDKEFKTLKKQICDLDITLGRKIDDLDIRIGAIETAPVPYGRPKGYYHPETEVHSVSGSRFVR